MNSRPGADSSAPLRGGALAGALFGAVEARWALPAVPSPLLSPSEWWMTWTTAVSLGAAGGLLLGLGVRALFGNRAGRWASGLSTGLGAALPLFVALLLRLRPRFGPDGRELTLLVAAVGALVVLLYALAVSPRRRTAWLLAPALLLAALATASGWLLSLNPPAQRDPAAPASPSLLLLTLDTTRADHLPPDAELLEDDGFLRRLQRTAHRFTDLSAPVPLTGPSHASLMTALPPRSHGAQDNGWSIDPEVPTLAERLGEQGYATGAVLSAAVLHRELCGLDRGFREYDDSFRPADPLSRLIYVAGVERVVAWATGRSAGLSHQRRAQETVDIGIRFLERHADAPFFLWLHFYDPHAPYEPLSPPPPREVLPALAGEPGEDDAYWESRRAYAAEIRDMDRQLARLEDFVVSTGLARSTLLVVVSDHGESFGTHARGYRFDHGTYLFDDELRLGAWWREPGNSDAGEIAGAHGMQDLGTALVRRLVGNAQGLSSAMPPGEGFTLSHSTVAGDTLWFCLRRPERKLIMGRAPEGELVFEAYDLRRDPQEQHSLLDAGTAPSAVQGDSLGVFPVTVWIEDEHTLLDYAAGVRGSLTREGPSLSEEARERLRSLGYLR